MHKYFQHINTSKSQMAERNTPNTSFTSLEWDEMEIS